MNNNDSDSEESIDINLTGIMLDRYESKLDKHESNKRLTDRRSNIFRPQTSNRTVKPINTDVTNTYINNNLPQNNIPLKKKSFLSKLCNYICCK